MTQDQQLELSPTMTSEVVTRDDAFDNLRLSWAASKRSENTREAYLRDLDAFDVWVRSNGRHVLDATPTLIDLYVETMTQAGKSASSIARSLSGLSSFYTYSVRRQALAASPLAPGLIERPKVSSVSNVVGLSEAEATQLFKVATNPRDLALVRLMLDNGLRVSEVLALRIKTIQTVRGHNTIETVGKGGVTDRVPLAPPTFSALETIIDGRTEGYVFETFRGTAMTRQHVGRIVKRLAERAGLDASKVHPHAFRHSFVTISLEKGTPLHIVQRAAHHADPRTTQRYNDAREILDNHPAYLVAASVG